jgi:NAD(P)-dependent dehydrogenase (short-subunit alcohol dehydrogenase family)
MLLHPAYFMIIIKSQDSKGANTMKYVVITGVSSGLGYAAVEDLLKHGYHVFGSVRSLTDAARLQTQFGPGFTPLLFDVTDEAAIKTAADSVAQAIKGQGVFALINNAGMAIGGPLAHQPLDEVRRVLEVNVLGALAVTQAFLPLLGAKLAQTTSPGRIINISSIGGKISLPFVGAYATSKHALEAMSDVLRRELMIYGIDVIVIEPGSIKTAIWDKAEKQDASRYQHTDYVGLLEKFQRNFISRGRAGTSPEKVAQVIRQALESKHPRTRYALPDHFLTGWLLPRFLPDRALDRQIASRIGLTPR